MSSKSEKDRAKQIQDKCQSLLTSMLRDDDNKYCVDCDSKGPRWASWNLGVFLCIRCAGIHRNLGVHISRVKSVNLDTWTPEQVVSLQQMGNSRARAVYEALLPDGFRRPQTDCSLEAFIRAKYEQKKYLAKEWVPPPPVKVDWDKEIDEELEKQKKKKKTASSISAPAVKKPEAIPQLLPMPNAKTNSSPVSGRNREQNKPAVNVDLLGLDTKPTNFPEDFTNFLPNEPAKVISTSSNKNDSLKAEEENFFNQQVPAENEKQKLTKDSILALYDTVPGKISQMSSQSNAFGNFPMQTFPQNNLQGAFINNQQAFPINSLNNVTDKNAFFHLTNNQQQFQPQEQFNAFQQVPHANAQQFHNTLISQNLSSPYVQNNSVNLQQNGANFSKVLQNGPDLFQGAYSQNNVVHSTSDGFASVGQNFGQMNQCFGLSQQFENININKQNHFNSTSNIWQ